MAVPIHSLHRGGRKYGLNDYTSDLPYPQIAGYTTVAAFNSSYTLVIPNGSAIGNVAIIFGGHGYNFNTPSGWTVNNATGQGNWNGCIFTKILTGTDISNGNVVVTTGGAYDGCIILVVCRFTTSVKQALFSTTAGGAGTWIGPSVAGILPSQLALLFGSNRGNNVPSSDTGISVVTFTDSSAASATLYTSISIASINPTFTYSGGNSGVYQAVVVV